MSIALLEFSFYKKGVAQSWATPFSFSLCIEYTLYVVSLADYRMPCAIMALATFMNPATFAPFT